MKIFQIGFNRCGTRTLHYFFQENGVASVHWDNSLLARTILRNVLEGLPPIHGYGQYDSFSDMEAFELHFVIDAFKFFPIFHQYYPDAIFILNTRSQNSWIESRLRHAGGDYANLYRKVLGDVSDKTLVEHWKRDWDHHHNRVYRYFAARKGRLITFNIEEDKPEKLIAAMPELNLDAGKYGHVKKEARGLTRKRAP